jgi:hypothetical protein
MIVKGTVVSIEHNIQVPKNGGGSYPGSRLTYRDEAGAIKDKCLHDNVFKFKPGLKTQLSNLSTGQHFDMEQIKEGEFLNVQSIVPSNAGGVAVAQESKQAPIASPKNTYETADERAHKQVYIVRQSSISSAIALLPKAKVEDILQTAKQFEEYVFGKNLIETEQENEIV